MRAHTGLCSCIHEIVHLRCCHDRMACYPHPAKQSWLTYSQRQHALWPRLSLTKLTVLQVMSTWHYVH